MSFAESLPTVAPSNDMVAVAATREAQEVQAAVISAKRFPRDQRAAYDRIMKACARPSLAEAAMYVYERGGQEVSGPSIRLAEVVAQNWGNLQFGVRELTRESGASICEAYCWDIETNVRKSMIFNVAHVRDLSGGKSKALTSERDVYEMIANMGARRVRNCIMAVVPGDIIEAAAQECEKTLGELGQKKEMVLAMVAAYLKDFRVTREDIERRLGKRIEAITTPEFVQLRKIYKSLQDKMSEPADWFPQILDPEKIKKEQSEPSKPFQTTAAADADRKLAEEEFEKAFDAVVKQGGKPEEILGEKVDDVLKQDVATIQNRADILSAWKPK